MRNYDELAEIVYNFKNGKLAQPKKIKMSKEFFDNLIAEIPVVFHDGEPIEYYKTFMGVPFEIDDNVNKFEIY